jgi:hypothetical protein
MIHASILALALAAQSTPEPVAITPAQFAQAIQGIVGQTYDSGTTIARVYADGPIVVVVFDGPAGWRTPAAVAHIGELFIGSFCEGRDFEYFVNGNQMRIDTTEGGSTIRSGAIVRACPAQAAHPQ